MTGELTVPIIISKVTQSYASSNPVIKMIHHNNSTDLDVEDAYIGAGTGGSLGIASKAAIVLWPGSTSTTAVANFQSTQGIRFFKDRCEPCPNNTYSLGETNTRFTNVYATNLYGTLNTTDINGVDATNGSETQCLTKKGTWKTFGTSDLTIGTTASTAMAGNTTVTNVNISSDDSSSAQLPLVFATTNTTAEKNEGLKKNSAKIYANLSSGKITASHLEAKGSLISGYSTADLTKTNNDVSSDTTTGSFQLYDGAGHQYGEFNSVACSNGKTCFSFKIRNYNGSSATGWKFFSIYVAKDGTVSYYLDGGSAFCSAIGASTTDTKVNVINRGTTKAYLLATTTAPTSSNQTVTAVAESAVYLGTESGGGHLYATAVHNAVWNDYAEYRAATSYIEPGRVVIDTDNGEVILATKRLQPGAQVVSDTWGHIMGETESAKTPLAVAGRVLVYPYKDRKEYHAGMCVCSAPNGTVDIMTRDEIKEYPDCIIGIVSEIPEYEYWGSGNVEINGRIWVKVR